MFLDAPKSDSNLSLPGGANIWNNEQKITLNFVFPFSVSHCLQKQNIECNLGRQTLEELGQVHTAQMVSLHLIFFFFGGNGI
jgi:hypothetical protein